MAERLTVGVAARLSRYLQVLTQARKMGKERISSQEIAEYTNINATQIRRDLSAFGRFGKRGVGYRTDALLDGDPQDPADAGPAQHRARRAPAGSGSAIASSPIFAEHGINIAAIFETDPEKVGQRVGDITRQLDRRRRARSAASRTSSWASSRSRPRPRRKRRTRSIGAGVKIIFNYSEALLDVPADVNVHTSNPAVELLYALYFHLT